MYHTMEARVAAVVEMRKQAFLRLGEPLRDTVMEQYAAQKNGVKTAAELASINKALFLHSSVP